MDFSKLLDEDLISGLRELVIEECERLALQLSYIAELDRRKITYQYSSLWAYLVEEMKLEEWKAERLIKTARMIRKFPGILGEIEAGRLNLSLLEIAQSLSLREALDEEEFVEVLQAISGKSCRAARRTLAALYPGSVEVPRDRIRPLTEELSEVRFVARNEVLDKVEEIRGLLAHSHPGLTLGDLMDFLTTDYLARHHPEEKARRAEERKVKKEKARETPEATEVPSAPRVETAEPRRAASQPMKHALILREGYQCAFVDPITGVPCHSRHGLQIHHCQEWSLGGRTELENLSWRCARHHARESFLKFGEHSQYTKTLSTA